MNLQMINMRSKCCTLLREMKITEETTKQCRESELLKNLVLIKEKNISSQIAGLPENIQTEILQKECNLRYMMELIQPDISNQQIVGMLKNIQLKELMEYAPEEVRSLLCMKQCNEEYIGTYLKYYRNDGLSEEEMLMLWKGLEWFRRRRTDLTDEWLGCIEKRRLFMQPVITDNFIRYIEDYDKCLETLAQREDVILLLNKLNEADDGRAVFDESNMEEICANTERLTKLWEWLRDFLETEQMPVFLSLWLQNHALVYDLEFLQKKVQNGQEIEKESFLTGRTSYIAFLYNEEIAEEFESRHEELMIYAITHKKKAFLNLVRENMELYQSIPFNSILFYRTFYEKCLNVNTMNKKNLSDCKTMKCSGKIAWSLLERREHTFGEMALIYSLPENYVRLYESFSARRTDERICIMREIVKSQSLPGEIRQEELSKNLMKKRLSQWMKKDFSHIEDLSHQNAVCLLSEYDMLAGFIPDMNNNAEVRYVWNNIEQCKKYASMEEIRRHSLEENEEWKYLVKTFDFSEQFIAENQKQIRKFIFEDGAHIMKIYCESQKGKQEALRRLTSAELMGRFKELKYYQNDLIQEIDFPITDRQKKVWMENSSEEHGELAVWEEDGLLPVMQMGVKPYRTCLSYEDGMYRQCLLACHDSNKKVLYLSYRGKVVLRAAVRLTKGKYGEVVDDKKKPQLQFADLMVSHVGNGQESKHIQEFLTLFVERSYISGLPQEMEHYAYDLILKLMRRKAERMNAVLAVSMSYQNYLSDELHPIYYSMYISKSKAGEQYLDSLGGNNCVDKEGSYKYEKFLIDRLAA